ncbi:MAG: sel1 repeat family protein [Betaproteobacteria bacterium]|nr:sel1 repeat family protein [Betaproteobacteria bacterium]
MLRLLFVVIMLILAVYFASMISANRGDELTVDAAVPECDPPMAMALGCKHPLPTPELERRAADNDVNAQLDLGLMYYRGCGVLQDYRQAAIWTHRAARQGNAQAQYNMGIMHEGGCGVPQDFQQAASWYQKSAEQEYTAAQNNLGAMYFMGRLPQDFQEALNWYSRAAERGDATALLNLGIMYADGAGVRQDKVLAYTFYKLAAAEGNEEGAWASELIEKLMTSRQIEEGQSIISQWQPGYLLPTTSKTGYREPRWSWCGAAKPLLLFCEMFEKE